MIVEESLSYFTKPLKINPDISDELESVASMGFKRDGFADVAKCNVDALKPRVKSKSIKKCIT